MLNGNDLDRIREALRSGTKGSKIQKNRLWKLLSQKLEPDLDRAEIAEGLSVLQKYGEITGQFGHGMHPYSSVELNIAEPETPENIKQWQNQVVQFQDQLSGKQFDALMTAPTVVTQLSASDQVELITGLIAYSKDTGIKESYIASAKHILGSSKAIDVLGKSIQEAFKPEGKAQDDRTQYVLTAGLKNPKTVIIIENMAVFTAFSQSDCTEMATAICSFGYGLGSENLLEKISQGSIKSCPVIGERYDLKQIFSAPEVLFWGDLDSEGLSIFENLKQTIPDIKLSAAYGLMFQRIRKTSHPYNGIAKKSANQRHPKTDDPLVSLLSNAAKKRALDQEAVCDPWPGDIVIKSLKELN